MEKLVEAGLIEGVLDVTTTEVADEVAGGVLACGPARFDAMLESEPKDDTPPNPDRVRGETRVLTCGIYRREIAHRQEKRKSFRSVTLDT